MDWTAFSLTLTLAAWTCALLLPLAIVVGRQMAWRKFKGRSFLEALIALPLVLPPTVLGYYLLVSMGSASPFGRAWESLFGQPLVFHFGGLLAASVLVNIPFAIQPVQRAFEAIAPEVREAAWTCGMSRWTTFRRVELPLAWPGILSALALTFAHTMGEFGVILMVGGNIPGETKTIAVAIYDRTQAMDYASAGIMSAALLVFSMLAIGLTHMLTGRIGRKYV
jgi:molybdate transport system permease protein